MDGRKLEKITVSTALVVMFVLTVAYTVYVGYAIVNNNANDWHLFDYYEPSNLDPIYYASLYQGQPTTWYYPEQLAIGGYWDNNGNLDDGFWIVVDRDNEPFNLQARNAIFKLNEKFYQVSSLWVTPALPKEPLDIAVVSGGVGISGGWCFTGILYYRWRKHAKANQHHNC